ncbi:MAG: response regulator [Candidatus Magnetoovum sp. WYHC-5]|nr:response regulator [Candidatus Magnetoovum sp. WYHC-5]
MLLSEEGYTIIPCADAVTAYKEIGKQSVNMVLTDIKMPGVSGVELLGKIHLNYPDLPVILMTAFAELDMAIDAIRKGAFDFIIKPYKYEQLLFSVKRALKYDSLIRMEKNYKQMLKDTVEQKTQELSDALKTVKNLSNEVIKRLTTAAEYRDMDTGEHILRIGLYASKLAEEMDMSEEFTERITVASQLHDIGKIGIPDSILLKPGKLTPVEFEAMKTHTTIGANILFGSTQPMLQMACSIAANHHERWDGTGYPVGLKGINIPIEARIVIICDQYDALMSKRPYKTSLSHREVYEIITKGDGRTMPQHFDPDVFRSFIKLEELFREIFTSHSD